MVADIVAAIEEAVTAAEHMGDEVSEVFVEVGVVLAEPDEDEADSTTVECTGDQLDVTTTAGGAYKIAH